MVYRPNSIQQCMQVYVKALKEACRWLSKTQQNTYSGTPPHCYFGNNSLNLNTIWLTFATFQLISHTQQHIRNHTRLQEQTCSVLLTFSFNMNCYIFYSKCRFLNFSISSSNENWNIPGIDQDQLWIDKLQATHLLMQADGCPSNLDDAY